MSSEFSSHPSTKQYSPLPPQLITLPCTFTSNPSPSNITWTLCKSSQAITFPTLPSLSITSMPPFILPRVTSALFNGLSIFPQVQGNSPQSSQVQNLRFPVFICVAIYLTPFSVQLFFLVSFFFNLRLQSLRRSANYGVPFFDFLIVAAELHYVTVLPAFLIDITFYRLNELLPRFRLRQLINCYYTGREFVHISIYISPVLFFFCLFFSHKVFVLSLPLFVCCLSRFVKTNV